MRGPELEALFHAITFFEYNKNHTSLKDFLDDERVSGIFRREFLEKAGKLLIKGNKREVRVASMIENRVSEYISPNSADVWIMEEPTNRGAGQVNRVIEQNRSEYGDVLNPVSAALCHQAYRTDEFLRFRKPLRDNGKIIIRSRSEESACYQIFDEKSLPNGISREHYLSFPGHKVAFGNSPTHLFIVHGPENWAPEEYIKLKEERALGRITDDHESDVQYQLLVNKRYATNWLEELYQTGCAMWEGNNPKIVRFNIYDSREEIADKMTKELERILKKQG
ncbi:MAG: hypothetical protein WD876_03795 [Candidatus Pacearchaeota archaeon]